MTGCIFLISPWVAEAQVSGIREGAVNGTGTMEIKRPAQLLRMKVQLVSKGKDLKDALSKLEERSAAAVKQMEGLGAAKDAVQLGPPEIQEADPNVRRQLDMMMAQRGRAGKKKSTKTAVPVSVACTLEVDWDLAGSGAELLLAAHQLEGKIKAADVGGAQEASQLSPEEQELLEEMQEGFNAYGNPSELKPGEPVFAYVSRISDEDRDAALQSAFRKAKDQAALLAKAAGLQLGAVRSLSTYGSNSWNSGHRNDYARIQRMQMAFGSLDDDNGQAPLGAEAIGTSPTAVKHVITVTASFDAQ
jgi:hypothetical protein